MKTITRSNIYLPVAAMILAVALAVPAAAQKQVPFKGTMQGLDQDTAFTPTTVSVTTKGTGIATQLGQFTFRLDNTVTFATGTSAGSATFVAANGDSISATVTGWGEFIAPHVISIMETYTITGGTGRFAGAQGIFIMERMADETFLTSGSFHGSITSPGAAH
jgi:hypothetical protein